MGLKQMWNCTPREKQRQLLRTRWPGKPFLHNFCFQGLSRLPCARWSQVLSHTRPGWTWRHQRTSRRRQKLNCVLICFMPERMSLSLPWRHARKPIQQGFQQGKKTCFEHSYFTCLLEERVKSEHVWLARGWASCVGLLGVYCIWGRIMQHWETNWFYSHSFYRLVLFSPGYKVVGLLTSARHIHSALNSSWQCFYAPAS